MGFERCLIYTVVTGILGFVLGRLVPGPWFRWDAPPFRELPFENGGHFYRKIGIHHWHKRMPDMSRILPGLMPEKRVTAHISAKQVEIMIQETCIAESTHILLSILGLAHPFLWPGWGGILWCCAYFLVGNLPFILIQRFNRPKLCMLLEKCRQAEARSQSQKKEDAQAT